MRLSKRRKKDIFILSCAAEGGDAFIASEILHALEEEMRMQGGSDPLVQYFDVFSSTGSGTFLLSLLLSKKYPLADISDIFTTQFSHFFIKDTINLGKKNNVLGDLVAPEYSALILREHIEELLGSILLKEIPQSIFVPLYDMLNFEPFFANSHDHENMSIVDLSLASLATPQYLTPISYKDTDKETDRNLFNGTLYSAQLANLSAQWVKTHMSDYANMTIHMIIVGTGISALSKHNTTTYANWVHTDHHSPILQLLKDVNIQVMDYLLQHGNNVQVYKLDGHLGYTKGGDNPYEISESHIEVFQNNAIAIIHQNRLTIKKLVSVLLQKKKRG